MKKIFTTLFSFLALAATVNAQSLRPFRAGDRVVFVGNSITDGGHYHSYIWLYYMTHFPNMRITCFNAGIGGDAMIQISNRFDADVLSKKPTLLTLTWGMNDTGYFQWGWPNGQEYMDKEVEKSFAIYTKLEDKLKSHPEIQKVIILGSPYDETTKSNPKNLYKGKAAEFAKVIDRQEAAAKTNGWPIVDFNHPMLAIEKQYQATDSLFNLTPNDRIHPDNDGHLVMAYLFLKTQGLNGLPVADMQLNAGGKVAKMTNCLISNVAATAGTLSFDYLAKSLPYPIDSIPRAWGNKKPQAEGLKYVPFTKDFNSEMLAVKGLKAGSYTVKIDGEVIGKWSADELAGGLNLADHANTPEYQQAIQVRELNEERWEIERRLRNYQWVEWDFLKDKNLLFKDDAATMDTVKKYAPKNPFLNGNMDNYSRARFKNVRDAWQKEMDALVDQIYAINKPVKRRIEIVAAQ